MALQLVQVNVKTRDDSALGRFWAYAPGWDISGGAPGVTNVEPMRFVWPDPSAVCIDVVRVPDSTPRPDPGDNRFCVLSRDELGAFRPHAD